MLINIINKYKTHILLLSVTFLNFTNNKLGVKSVINSYFLFYLYKSGLLYDFFLNTIDNMLRAKLYISSLFKKKKFKLKNAILYTDLKTPYIVYNYFRFNVVKALNNELLDNIISDHIIKTEDSSDIRLKLFFTYEGKDYIMYHTYNNNNIPYPLFTDEIIQNYRNDIILPYYPEKNKSKSLYSLFSMYSKDIHVAKINETASEAIKNYLLSIQTPFYDFGILYKMPVKLEWIIAENNITNFDKLYIRFLNLYLDEENMDLINHEINMTKDNLNDNISSDIINNFINIFKMECESKKNKLEYESESESES